MNRDISRAPSATRRQRIVPSSMATTTILPSRVTLTARTSVGIETDQRSFPSGSNRRSERLLPRITPALPGRTAEARATSVGSSLTGLPLILGLKLFSQSDDPHAPGRCFRRARGVAGAVAHLPLGDVEAHRRLAGPVGPADLVRFAVDPEHRGLVELGLRPRDRLHDAVAFDHAPRRLGGGKHDPAVAQRGEVQDRVRSGVDLADLAVRPADPLDQEPVPALIAGAAGVERATIALPGDVHQVALTDVGKRERAHQLAGAHVEDVDADRIAALPGQVSDRQQLPVRREGNAPRILERRAERAVRRDRPPASEYR